MLYTYTLNGGYKRARVEDKESLKIFITNLKIIIEFINKLANNRKVVIDKLVNEVRS